MSKIIRGTVNIDEYLPVARQTPVTDPDGNTCYYWDQAFQLLMADIVSGYGGYEDSGVTIQFNLEKYYFAYSLLLNRGINITGTGGAGQRPGTVLVFENSDAPGIVILPITKQSRSRGAFSIVERVTVAGPVSPQAIHPAGDMGNRNNHGILMRATAYIRDCNINGFNGDGININASVGVDEDNPDYGNANHYQIATCYIGNCGRNGLHAESGGDTSAGLVSSVFCGGNREWGIFDNSTFGSTFLACSCYENKAGAYKSRGGALFLNCYTEGEQSSEVNPPGFIMGGNIYNIPVPGEAPLDTNNLAFGSGTPSSLDNGIGGISLFSKTSLLAFACLGGYENTALALRASVAPILQKLRPEGDPGNPADLIPAGKAENLFGANTPTENFADQQTAMSYLQIDRSGWWKMTASGQDSFAFSTDKAAEGVGQFWLPNGFYLGGASSNRNKIASGNYDIHIANADANLNREGDIVFNDSPVLNDPLRGFAGFVCVNDPDNAGNRIWAGFGKIEKLQQPV